VNKNIENNKEKSVNRKVHFSVEPDERWRRETEPGRWHWHVDGAERKRSVSKNAWYEKEIKRREYK